MILACNILGNFITENWASYKALFLFSEQSLFQISTQCSAPTMFFEGIQLQLRFLSVVVDEKVSWN